VSPREALLALVACDPNRSYSVNVCEWAHVPTLAGNPPRFETFVEVTAQPGFDGVQCSGFWHEETIQGAVARMLAAIRRDNARSALAMAFEPCPTCGLPASTTPSAETEPKANQ
jgi:hypothetical protein